MMEGMNGMIMRGMSFAWLPAVLLLFLGAAALVKYLFFSGNK